MSSDGHYEITTTTDNSDVYTSVLKIHNLRHNDYGEYFCRVANSLETIRAPIRLQPKGAPEKPNNLQAPEVGPNYVTLMWDPGFDGGLSNTKFFVLYRKVVVPHDDQVNGECGPQSVSSSEWMEFDCHRDVPCNITPLDQHQSYVFKVRFSNIFSVIKIHNLSDIFRLKHWTLKETLSTLTKSQPPLKSAKCHHLCMSHTIHLLEF